MLNIATQAIISLIIIGLMTWIVYLQTELNISRDALSYWKDKALQINQENKLYKQIMKEINHGKKWTKSRPSY